MRFDLRRRTRAVRHSAYDLWSDGRGGVLGAVALGWLLGLGVRLVFPAVLPQIRSEFGMSLATAGVLLAALWLGYAVMQFPGGILADKYGERAILTGSFVVATAGIIGVILAPTVLPFFLATVLVGLGVGLYGTTRLTVLVDVFPEKGGTAIGLTQAAGNIGTTVLPAAGGLLAAQFGWRYGFGMLAVPFLLMTAGLWVTIPQRTSVSADVDLSKDSLSYVLRTVQQPSVMLINTALTANMVVYQSFTGFYPTYLTSTKGLSDGAAATFLGLFFAVAIVFQPVAGAIRDQLGTRVTLIGVLVTSAVAIGTLPFVDSTFVLIGLTLGASATLAVWPVANAYMAEVAPDDIQGTVVGVTRTVYIGIGAAGPVVVGILGDRGQLDLAFLSIAGVLALAVIPTFLLPSTAAGE